MCLLLASEAGLTKKFFPVSCPSFVNNRPSEELLNQQTLVCHVNHGFGGNPPKEILMPVAYTELFS
jgi:hypothetical protein